MALEMAWRSITVGESSTRPVKTALHQAVLDGRLHQVRLLVDKHRGNVDAKDLKGRTPLMLACLLTNVEDGYRMARIFLRAGAYPNARDHMGRSALHFACMKGRLRIADLLLKDDVTDAAMADENGNTALLHSALSGKPELVRRLVAVSLRLGMDTDARNASGHTALLLACRYGHFASAYVLLTVGKAQPTLRDNEFRKNASEWVQHFQNMSRPPVSSSVRHPSPAIARFGRDNTLYGREFDHVCYHGKTKGHSSAQSLSSTLQLPSIFSTDASAEKPEESFIDGMSSRMLLQAAIAEVTKCDYHFHEGAGTGRRTAPTTAKLLAAAPQNRPMFPDISAIFRLYSEQCIPHTEAISDMDVREPSCNIQLKEQKA